MKNIKLVKKLFVIMLAFAVMFIFVQANDIFAEDDDFFNRIEANVTTGNNTVGNSTENTVGNNTSNTNQITNGTSIGNISGTNTTNQLANRNVSNSNELADTGIGSTGGIITLIVVICGISAIYSYRKVNDYKNL